MENYNFNRQIDYELKNILDKCHICFHNEIKFITKIDNNLDNETKAEYIIGINKMELLKKVSNFSYENE